MPILNIFYKIAVFGRRGLLDRDPLWIRQKRLPRPGPDLVARPAQEVDELRSSACEAFDLPFDTPNIARLPAVKQYP